MFIAGGGGKKPGVPRQGGGRDRAGTRLGNFVAKICTFWYMVCICLYIVVMDDMYASVFVCVYVSMYVCACMI